MRLKIKHDELIFIIAVVLCTIYYFNGMKIENDLQHLVSFVWIIYSMTRHKDIKYRGIARYNLKLAIIPIVAMMTYTVCLWLLIPPSGAGTTFSYFTRLLSTNTYLVLQFLFAYTAFKMFGERTIDLIWKGMVLNYLFFSIIPALLLSKPVELLNYLLLNNMQSTVNYYLEANDVIFAFGVLFIYYFVIGYKKRTMLNIRRLIITAIFMYIGYKRIEILAIAVFIFYYYIIDVHFTKIKKKTAVITTIILLSALFFVWMIYSGALNYISLRYGIEFNYRLDTWAYWAERTSFGIRFPGLGVNYVDKDTYLMYLQSGMIQNGHVLVAGMHSDLFKKYVELGFIAFCLWIIYFVYYKTIKLNERFGKWPADLYLLLTLYIVILYLTDNVYNYFAMNICYFVAPMLMCAKIRKAGTVQEGVIIINDTAG